MKINLGPMPAVCAKCRTPYLLLAKKKHRCPRKRWTT